MSTTDMTTVTMAGGASVSGQRMFDPAYRNVSQVDLLSISLSPSASVGKMFYVLVAVPELGAVWPVFLDGSYWALTQMPSSQLSFTLSTPEGWYRQGYNVPLGTLASLTVAVYTPDGSPLDALGGYALFGIRYTPRLEVLPNIQPSGPAPIRTLMILDSSQHVSEWIQGADVYDMICSLPLADHTGLHMSPIPAYKNILAVKLLAMAMPPMFDGTFWEPYILLSIPELGISSWAVQAQYFSSSEDIIRWQVVQHVHSKWMEPARTASGGLRLQLHSRMGVSPGDPALIVRASQTCNQVRVCILLELWTLPMYPF